MFQGTTLITLDDKGRLALPKRARDEAAADGVIVAARHPDGCLVLYPPSAWAPKRDALLKLPFSARGFVRLVLGSAEELKVMKLETPKKQTTASRPTVKSWLSGWQCPK